MTFRPHHRGYWTGIEAWAPYVERFDLASKYDRLIIADVREIGLPAADCYIAGDMLEHMPRDDALGLIARIQRAADHLFVSVPIVAIEQHAVGGNRYEVHQHQWSHDGMRTALDPCDAWCGDVLGVYVWSRSAWKRVRDCQD